VAWEKVVTRPFAAKSAAKGVTTCEAWVECRRCIETRSGAGLSRNEALANPSKPSKPEAYRKQVFPCKILFLPPPAFRLREGGDAVQWLRKRMLLSHILLREEIGKLMLHAFALYCILRAHIVTISMSLRASLRE